jgi:hypothetical protein
MAAAFPGARWAAGVADSNHATRARTVGKPLGGVAA